MQEITAALVGECAGGTRVTINESETGYVKLAFPDGEWADYNPEQARRLADLLDTAADILDVQADLLAERAS